MIEPWFDPNRYAWIPGTVYGLVAGLMGGLVGWLVPRGRAKNFILRAWFTVWAVAIVLLVVGSLPWLAGSSGGFGSAYSGAIGTLVVGANSIVILKRYREVEERRVEAKDLF